MTTAPCKKLTVGYTRVSTDEQAREGVSLAVQREKLGQWEKLHDASVDIIIEDAGYSGKTMRRPGMQRLLGMIERGEVGTVVILRLDRLSRSVKDTANFVDLTRAKDVSFVSIIDYLCTTTATGRMVVNMRASVAQWESEINGERVAEAIKHIQANGGRWGAPPYGYQVRDGRLLTVPEEQETMRVILEHRKRGETYRTIMSNLHSAGIKPRRGERFSLATIMRIVRREAEAEAP